MKVETRIFGEIDIAEEKIIYMEKGIIGFPELKRFAIIFNEEKGRNTSIMWFQSMDEPDIALPVMIPNIVKSDYNPTVEDQLLEPLGQLTDENTYILVTVTVPKAIEEISVNLKAPIIINTDNHHGAQIITEDNFPVKYKIYEYINDGKEKAGE